MAGMRTGSSPCCPGSHSGPLPLDQSQTQADMLGDRNTGVILVCTRSKNEFNYNMDLIRNRLLDQCPHSQT